MKYKAVPWVWPFVFKKLIPRAAYTFRQPVNCMRKQYAV